MNLIKGYIYKLTCSETGSCYYGSTSDDPIKRFQKHLSIHNKCSSKNLISPTLEIMEEIIHDPRDKTPLLQAERSYIESNPCVNKKVPLRTWNELYQIKKLNPNYFKNMYIKAGGKEINNWTRVNCYCGCVYVERNIKRHLKTHKHLDFISSCNSN